MQVTDGKAQHRNRPKRIEQICRNPFLAEHQGCVPCKFGTVSSAVIRNYNAAFCFLWILHQISRKAFCCATDIVFIHTVRTSSKHSPHAGGSKAEFCIKPVLNFLFIIPD